MTRAGLKLGRGNLLLRSAIASLIATLLGLLGNQYLFPRWGFSNGLLSYLGFFLIVLVAVTMFGRRGIIYSPLIGIVAATVFIFLTPSGYSVAVTFLNWFCHAAIATIAVFLANSFVR
ncbi:MAG: hypothetical protein QXW42_04270 [Thermofilum sp.]